MRMFSSKFLLVVAGMLAFSKIGLSQVSKVTVSGVVIEAKTSMKLPYVNVMLKSDADSAFAAGTVTDDQGRFSLSGISPGSYFLELTYIGHAPKSQPVLVGRLSEFLDLGSIDMLEE